MALALAGIMMLSLQTAAAHAAQLLMFEEKHCSYCERWEAEIGVMFHKTEESRRAPLERVDIHGARPEGITLASDVHYTPTFVLVSDGREIDRIEGYPGEDFFWAMLARMLERLPSAGAKSEEKD